MMTKVLQGWNLLAIGTVLSGQALLIAAAQAELLTHNHGLVTEGTSLIDNEALIPDESVPDATLDGLLVHTLEPTTIHSEQATHRPSSLTAQTSEANRIVDIQLDETDSGVEIVLATEARTLSLPQTQVSGNALIVTIANAVLALPEGEEFLVFEPAEGIAVIQAVNLTEDTVQLSITGTAAPPIAEVTAEAQTLRLGVTLGVPAVATPEEDSLQLVVTGEEGSRYVVPSTSTATRTDTPLDEVPQSIQVIPQEVLEDQQVIRLNDALRNASGVLSNSLDQRGQRFIVRGFNNSSILRNGFRYAGNAGFQELANVERIEVLKGPAAILAGALQPGGAINLVTEQPLSEPYYEYGLRIGNRALVEPSIDISGPLSEDGRVLYRLNALYRNEDYHRDFDTQVERYFVAPVISWAISERTDLTLELEYSEEERPADFGGLPAIGDRVADVPFDRITGEPGDDALNEFLRVGYQFEHRFNENWKVRNSFRFISFDTEFVSNLSLLTDPNTGNIFRVWIQSDQPSDSYELQTNVVGEFSTGSIEHTLLAGVDLYRRDFTAFRRTDLTPQPLFNIFDPVYGQVSRPDSFNDPIPKISESRTDSLGLYVQDQITLLDNLFLLAGVRYDTVTQDSEDFTLNTTDSRSNDAFSPRVGLVYQPRENLSLYTSYSTSFVPNSGTTSSGELLEPERGRQVEVGARAELLEGRLTANLALFNIIKRNVATLDPASPPGQFASIATGKQRSQGVELDVIGEILPGWNLVANYAYTDADITQDNDGLEGNRLFGVPEHNVNLWTTYAIQQGDFAGLGFGLGFNYLSERFGDNANSFVLEDYFLTNAAVSYQRHNWRAAINIRNLFDVDYIDSSEGIPNIENRPGEGLTIIGSFSIEF